MTFRSWLSTSHVRHFPATVPGRVRTLRIDAARNERFDFQLALRGGAAGPQEVVVEARAPRGWRVRVRRVGYVPMRHHNTGTPPDELDGPPRRAPGYVPDPLFDENALLLPPGETHAFWLTVDPAPNVRPGEYEILVRASAGLRRRLAAASGRRPAEHAAKVTLHDVTIQPRRDFPIIHWFYVDALLDFYDCAPFDRRFWQVLPNYFRNLADHGVPTAYTPVFTPPLDGVKRPSQLLRVRRAGKDRYRFDWRDVKRYVDLARTCGITHFEWTHHFTQWGVKNAIRIYEGQGADEKLLWPPNTGATSRTYRAFLAQYLPQLKRFLDRHRLMECSFFHVSDEPHGDEHLANYRKARALLKELAPWMKVMDALSDIRFGRQKITDVPAAGIRTALDFVAEGIPCWCYYCCGPRGRFVQRLMDTPLPKIRMNGWLFYRWPFKGFLHWGYNYWYKSQTRVPIDPYTVQDGLRWPGWAYGDPFQVYPGADGPVDSIRWEVFARSLQEYALLQTLGVDRGHPLLRPIRSFEDFPKTDKWLLATRRRLLSGTWKSARG